MAAPAGELLGGACGSTCSTGEVHQPLEVMRSADVAALVQLHVAVLDAPKVSRNIQTMADKHGCVQSFPE